MTEDKEQSPSVAVEDSKESREAPESSSESNSDTTGTKRRGRPRKSLVASKKPGGRGKVGRPKGDTAIMADYKSRMLASPKSRKVIAKVFDVALEDGHPHQAACMKMIMDRVAPPSSFIESKTDGAPKIEINFNMPDGTTPTIHSSDDRDSAIDGEFEPVGDSDD
jgi:hypothetical protein